MNDTETETSPPTRVQVHLLVNVDPHGVIACDGHERFPYEFKAGGQRAAIASLVSGRTTIVGSRSISVFGGRPPGARVIVVARGPRRPSGLWKGAETASSPLEALAMVDPSVEPIVYVLGGVSVFAALLPFATVVRRYVLDLPLPMADGWPTSMLFPLWPKVPDRIDAEPVSCPFDSFRYRIEVARFDPPLQEPPPYDPAPVYLKTVMLQRTARRAATPRSHRTVRHSQCLAPLWSSARLSAPRALDPDLDAALAESMRSIEAEAVAREKEIMEQSFYEDVVWRATQSHKMGLAPTITNLDVNGDADRSDETHQETSPLPPPGEVGSIDDIVSMMAFVDDAIVWAILGYLCADDLVALAQVSPFVLRILQDRIAPKAH